MLALRAAPGALARRLLAPVLAPVLVGFLLGGYLHAASAATSMTIGGGALPPMGFIDFCKRHRESCGAVTERPRGVALTRQLFAQLQDVQADVNRRVRPKGDLDQYGKREHWT